MGFYREQVVPRAINLMCGTPEMGKWRERVAEGLTGTVVEIGFGSGLNVPWYPADLDLVYAVEPSATARRLAEPRVADSPVPVVFVGLRGESLPLDDASCDGALCTFTLCTVPGVEQALSELRRVLKPGGRFHYLEHGLAPDPGVARWQHRIDPLEQRLADGCHLTRDPDEMITRAGFVIEHSESRFVPGPKPWSWFTSGRAVSPA